MQKFQSIALMAALFMAGSNLALAEPGGKRGPKDPDAKMERALSRLDLEEKQKTKIEKIRNEYKEQLSKLRDESKTKRKAFREKMDSNASNEEVKKAHEDLLESHNILRRTQFEMALAIRSELSEEQRAKMAEMRETRRNKMKDRRSSKRGKKRNAPNESPSKKE